MKIQEMRYITILVTNNFVLIWNRVLMKLFEILQWDILSNGGVVQEMAHIANGRDTGNCVSLLRVNVSRYLLTGFF